MLELTSGGDFVLSAIRLMLVLEPHAQEESELGAAYRGFHAALIASGKFDPSCFNARSYAVANQGTEE